MISKTSKNVPQPTMGFRKAVIGGSLLFHGLPAPVFAVFVWILLCGSIASAEPLADAFNLIEQHILQKAPLTEEQLIVQDQVIRTNLNHLATNPVAIKAAFNLVNLYESKVGAIFLTPDTRNGVTRDRANLARIMLDLEQGIIDLAYTTSNLAQHGDLFDGKMFKSSSYFPGAVAPPSNPGEVHTVRINASQITTTVPDFQRENPVRRPTGCYLAPGSVAMVHVPASLAGKGYAIRVGAHSWDLGKKPPHPSSLRANNSVRFDRVSLVYPVEKTETLIANPLGGGIYIEVPYGANEGIVTLEIKNAVRSPFFSARSFDKTTLAEWKKEQGNPGPWADFETDKFMMQVPTAWILKLDDPVALMRDWDKAMDAVSELFGHPLVRSRTVLYLQVDVTMRSWFAVPGYPQSNYPYNPRDPAKCAHEWMLKGPQFAGWTVFHEVGHSQLCSKFRGEGEALVNLPHVAVMNRKFGWSLDKAFGDSIVGMQHLTMDDVAVMWMVTENFRAGKEMNHSNKWGDEMKYQHRGFGKYVEIASLFGWDALSRFWQAVNENYKPGDTVPQNNDPVDDRILRLSKAAGADLTPLIHFWGIQPEDPKALTMAIRRAGLKSSRKIYDRLQHYATIIPMDNAAFRMHCNTIYPKGLGKAPNPLSNEGRYQAWLDKYNDEHGKAAHTALKEIIGLYFPEGPPLTTAD